MKEKDRIKGIYDRQVDRIYRNAMMFMKNEQDAEDIVQGIFLTIIEKDISFESEEHEKAWCITATRNRCKDVLKSSWKKRVNLEDSSIRGDAEPGAGDYEGAVGAAGAVSADSSEVDVGAYGDGELAYARAMLMSLPEDQREMIFLHYYEGYTVNEVAEMMGLKESTIRSGIKSAKTKLRKQHG